MASIALLKDPDEAFARGHAQALALGVVEEVIRVGLFPGNQVDDLNRLVAYGSNKQALSLDVHGHMIETAFHPRQNDCLDQFQIQCPVPAVCDLGTAKSSEQDHGTEGMFHASS
jgi:hypothetical protein